MQKDTPLLLDLNQRKGWVAHVFKAAFQNHHTNLAATFAPHVPKDAVVLDVGAHAGQFAKLFARLAPNGVVYAFEPSPYALSILEKAISWNRLRHVRIERYGLSDAARMLELRTPLKRRGNLGFGLAHLGDSQEARPARVDTIETRTLDSFADAVGLARLDFIKADVEGWEGRMLQGGMNTITRFRPAMFLELVHEALARSGMNMAEVWALLQPLGYRPAILNPDGSTTMVDAPTVNGDYLMIARA